MFWIQTKVNRPHVNVQKQNALAHTHTRTHMYDDRVRERESERRGARENIFTAIKAHIFGNSL